MVPFRFGTIQTSILRPCTDFPSAKLAQGSPRFMATTINPQIEQAYKVMQRLRNIFNEKVDYLRGGEMLMNWFRDVEALGREHFNTVVRTFKNNYKTIVNYFRSRATNASAESFNAKVKMFRTQLRGVSDPLFFIFRLCKLFA